MISDSAASAESRRPPPPQAPPPAPPLINHEAWSPDADLIDKTWLRRKVLHKERRRAGRVGRSVTDDDLDELCACIDLGFVNEVESDGGDRLAETFPALDLYYKMNRQCSELRAGESTSTFSDTTSSAGSSPRSIFSTDDSPNKVKAKLKRWAQVIAYAVRQRNRF